MIARNVCGRAVPLLVSMAAALALTACGGGDGDVPPVDIYESWLGNSNGVVVKDSKDGTTWEVRR